MDKITASMETLVEQAPWTTKMYFKEAIKDIDELFGEGYAKANPELVGQYIRSCSNDVMTGCITSALQEISESIDTLKSDR
ncbi:MAG: hypothetical protein HRT40_09135 [Campylobacteraceae bacterium]|nr:hypothetical protein [Campylobacteraceae bacterium]